MAKPNLHVVLFPFPAHGHISPHLNLAAHLHQYHSNLTVTLVSTPHNIAAIRSSLPPTSRLELHSLPFCPADHGLRTDSESTEDLPRDQFPIFFMAMESLCGAFDRFIAEASKQSTICIISDMFLGWTLDVAHKHNAFHSSLLGMSAFGGAVFLSLVMNLPHVDSESDPFTLPEYPEVVIHHSQLDVVILLATKTDPPMLFVQKQLSTLYKTDALLINTTEYLDPVGIGMLKKTLKLPVIPIGPLVGSSYSQILPSENESKIIDWLDIHPVASVLYISFGSQNSIQKDQMLELALGLEASKRPFIWVIRPPLGFNAKVEFKDEWLPDGFEKRMKEQNRGFFVHRWAPQIAILSHKATGAFLSHCGWNSVLESLNSGVPIIGWPLEGDQPFNATILVKLGLCVEVARGNMETSEVGKEKVADAVEMVMGDNEKGRDMREKTKEISTMLKGAWKDESCSSPKGLAEFLKLIETVMDN
ncbi:hypothetical protein LUZ61_015333 [Rhynchospora tenuis]|uniref:Glycosyltransferase n=1 Tax=Rhynchospora tenuis TaxID=198213 RepID=A0AAD5Z3K4_9POAL|nr:hypothetical protein LUZ61_015333 [Rhynchospora tenuis]